MDLSAACTLIFTILYSECQHTDELTNDLNVNTVRALEEALGILHR